MFYLFKYFSHLKCDDNYNKIKHRVVWGLRT